MIQRKSEQEETTQMTDDHCGYSIVVPVFNGSRTLHELHERLCLVMESLSSEYEIILVDDGSSDNSWDVISSIAKRDPRVLGILLMRNYSQANATIAGLKHAKHEYLITIDDDLQNPPGEIAKLVDAMSSNPDIDVVFGVPKEKQHSLWRRIASDFLNLVNSFVFKRTTSFKFTSFRLMKRNAVEPLFEMNVPVIAPGPLLCMVTTRMMNVTVDHNPRSIGRSGYSFMKLIRLTISRYLGFSLFPLRFLAIAGFLGILSSVMLGIIMLFRYFSGQIQVSGWTTLVLLLLAAMGFNFMGLSILGEYLQAVLLCARRMPTYLIREQVRMESASLNDHSKKSD